MQAGDGSHQHVKRSGAVECAALGAGAERVQSGACSEAEIADFRFHDLRHTAATRMAEAGVDAFTIAAILGHSNVQMTARYAHATVEARRRAVEVLAEKPGHNLVTAEFGQAR